MAKKNAINNFSQELTIDPGASGDSFVQFDINTTGEFRIGVDDNDGDAFKISQGSALGTNDTFVVTSDGEITKPLQSAFLAYLPSIQNNVTGAGVPYTLGGSGGTALTEVFDQNSDFVTDTFTAPVTGRYYLGTNFLLQAMVNGTNGTNNSIMTSNNTYTIGNDAQAFSGNNAYSYGQYVDMDASDTATITIIATGGTQIIDVFGEALRRTNFYGWLVC